MFNLSHKAVKFGLPCLAFALALAVCGLVTAQYVGKPPGYRTELSVPDGSAKWLAFLASENQIRIFAHTANINLDEFAGGLSQSKAPAANTSSAKIVSKLLENNVKIKPSRYEYTNTVVTVDHYDPEMIENFIQPYFVHLQARYFSAWSSTFTKIRENLVNSDLSLAAVTYADTSPTGIIDYQTNQIMQSGSPFMAEPRTSRKFYMTLERAVMISLTLAALCALLTFLMIIFRGALVRFMRTF